MKQIPFDRKKLDDHLTRSRTKSICECIMLIPFGVSGIWIAINLLTGIFTKVLFYICLFSIISGYIFLEVDHIRKEKQFEQLTEELLVYMKEEGKTRFTWTQLKENLWLTDDALLRYIHWLAECSCFPELGGTYYEEVYFTKKKEKKKEKKQEAQQDAFVTRMKSEEGVSLVHAYELFCETFSSVPKCFSKAVELLQADLSCLCRLVDYNGAQGVDIHKVYTYYIPSLVKTYDTYQNLHKIGAPALKESKQELLASMQTLHEALHLLCRRISKANQGDLSVELSTLCNVITVDGLGKEELSAS